MDKLGDVSEPEVLVSSTWRPLWATLIALAFGIPAVIVFGAGLRDAMTFAGTDDSGSRLAGLALMLSIATCLSSLPTVLSFAVFLVRGGRGTLLVEVGSALLVLSLPLLLGWGHGGFG